MYRYMNNRFGGKVAALLTACWYAALLMGVFYCAFEPQAELKYLSL